MNEKWPLPHARRDIDTGGGWATSTQHHQQQQLSPSFEFALCSPSITHTHTHTRSVLAGANPGTANNDNNRDGMGEAQLARTHGAQADDHIPSQLRFVCARPGFHSCVGEENGVSENDLNAIASLSCYDRSKFNRAAREARFARP